MPDTEWIIQEMPQLLVHHKLQDVEPHMSGTSCLELSIMEVESAEVHGLVLVAE